jgi:hypothetical protein
MRVQVSLLVTQCGKDQDGYAYCEETTKLCLTGAWGIKANGR